jgi:hypothetical protein
MRVLPRQNVAQTQTDRRFSPVMMEVYTVSFVKQRVFEMIQDKLSFSWQRHLSPDMEAESLLPCSEQIL